MKIEIKVICETTEEASLIAAKLSGETIARIGGNGQQRAAPELPARKRPNHLNKTAVQRVEDMLAHGYSRRRLAAEFDVAGTVIAKIARGEHRFSTARG